MADVATNLSKSSDCRHEAESVEANGNQTALDGLLKQLRTDESAPADYQELIREASREIVAIMARYRCAIMEIETKFKVLDEQFTMQRERSSIETIKTRLKSPDSILGKIKRKGLPLTLESLEKNVSDVAGVRVVCPFLEDVYFLGDCLLAQDDIRLVERKDYIKNPKPNGYRSLHLIVEVPIFLAEEKRWMKVEVQLRTIAMNFWASLEHQMRYKKDLPEDVSEALANELLDCANVSADLDMRMQHTRQSIDEALAATKLE